MERRRRVIRYWSAKAEHLPRYDGEPLHTALVEAMDDELDLFDRGPGRAGVPLEPVQVARYGAAVTGVVAYDHVFGRRPNPGPAPTPLAARFARQEEAHASVPAKALGTAGEDRRLLWKARRKEVA